MYAPLGVASKARAVLRPTAVRGTGSFEAIVVSSQHNCALASDGSVWCWGVNEAGQLGDGSATYHEAPVRVTATHRFKQLAASAKSSHTCALAADGAAYCWGLNADGQLGNGGTKNSPQPVAVAGGLKFVSIGAGRSHTCGVAVDDTVWCWGGGSFDGLGTDVKGGSRVPRRVAQ
jgi:alpha-tubulin suppressor-like RCC1 family protein